MNFQAKGPNVIRVGIAEDSAVVRMLLVQALSRDPQIEIAGVAANGAEAVELAQGARPDVLTMDVNMPVLDGLEATRRIMSRSPLPIVVVSASARPEEVELTFRAMEAGAVAVLEKPHGPGHPEHEAMVARIVQTVKLMSALKGASWLGRGVLREPAQAPSAPIPPPALQGAKAHGTGSPLVAIATSTGGPPALQRLLSQLPKSFRAPVLVVQHMTPGFIDGMIRWLQPSSALELRVARDKEPVLPGKVYFAPDQFHMGVCPERNIVLSSAAAEHGVRPSGSFLFRSVAEGCGAGSVGVVLTGMGSDGALELGLMRKQGALTIAQDAATSVVHGMPGQAIRLGSAALVLGLDQIAPAICAHLREYCVT